MIILDVFSLAIAYVMVLRSAGAFLGKDIVFILAEETATLFIVLLIVGLKIL